MTVADSSVVVDLLLKRGAIDHARRLFEDESPPIAPDVIVFETLSGIRRILRRAETDEDRAAFAVRDLGDLRIELIPSMGLRELAWSFRHNFTAGDSLFVALAERSGEPLATRDRRMARAAREHAEIETIEL